MGTKHKLCWCRHLSTPSRPRRPLSTHTTPAETAIPLEPLHPRAVTLWRSAALGRGALLAGAILAAEALVGTPAPFALPTAIVAVLALANAIIVPPLRYRAWGFAVRDTDLYLRHGVLFRTTSIVPYARIQHVDTRHGPIDRWLGLAELVVFTAGTRGAIVSIPALAMGTAESMRDQLAELSGAGDAV
jgi:uncharacterized protein